MNCPSCDYEVPPESQICTECGVSAEQDSPTVATAYFAISPARLLLLSILTASIYRIYWFYRNWSAIKKAEQRSIWPLWRAFFAIFFLHSLFKKIYLSAKSNGYQKMLSHWHLATGYIRG